MTYNNKTKQHTRNRPPHPNLCAITAPQNSMDFMLPCQSRKENTQCVLYSDPGQRVLYAFFTRSLRVFYLAQNRGLRQKQVVRCGPPQPPGCGAGLEVWQFAVACVPRATRHGRAIPEHTAPAESACFHGRSAASRPSLATRILPRFLSRSLRVFYSDHRQRVLYAFLRVFYAFFLS